MSLVERGNRGRRNVGNVTSTRADWGRLTEWLAERTEPVVIIPWSELNAIVGGLPDSATKHYPQWWQGDRPNTRAWRRAGYELVRVDLGRTVTLKKSTTVGKPLEAITRLPVHPSLDQLIAARSNTPVAPACRRLIPGRP